MFRWLLLCVAFIGLSGCMETAGPSFNGPTGTALNTAKCSQSSVGCLQKASQVCGGQYSVVDSESHSGGLLADILPGPVTWYALTYQCGPSDGKMPTFAFRGQQYVEPATVVVNTAPGPAAPGFSPPIRCESRQVGGMVQTTC
jgi:hypothetical protein